MLQHCLKVENADRTNPEVTKTNISKIMLFFWRAVRDKKSKFVKEREDSDLLKLLGIRNPLRKISLLGDVLL